MASHDLQEPLRMIHSFTQLLLRHHVDPHSQDAKEYGEFVLTAVKRMESLIQDLLAYSRVIHDVDHRAAPQEPITQTADLNVALQKALQLGLHGATIKHDTLPVVPASEPHLTQVLHNLISNAVKYRREDVVPTIEVSATKRDDAWHVCVRDNGIGFDPEFSEKIFGLFKRLHREAYPGTGLGLAICRRIIERQGGTIWAESDGPGTGARFWFTIPEPTTTSRNGFKRG